MGLEIHQVAIMPVIAAHAGSGNPGSLIRTGSLHVISGQEQLLRVLHDNTALPGRYCGVVCESKLLNYGYICI
jgi:hypothetical protein